jgi:gluconate kinase
MVCPVCGFEEVFAFLPLFVITGPSGSGKSTVWRALAGRVAECAFLETDILLQLKATCKTWRDYWHYMMFVGKCLNQNGRPTVLCTGGVPEDYESCVERPYFSAVHYLALVGDDDEIARRLRARPAWRGCTEQFVQDNTRRNQWYKENANQTDPPMTLLDTSVHSLQETVEVIELWIRERL